MNNTNDISGIEYWCFISYRHADNQAQDREWATWLHQEIERYDVPAELVGTTNARGDVIPDRIYPVFRDEESLSADADLGLSVAQALERSKFMIVLCSPRAVESKYVPQEVLYFKQLGNEKRIIAAIVSGTPGSPQDECFPSSLVHPLNETGDVDTDYRTEPIAADFRLADGSEGYTSAEAYRLKLRRTVGHDKKNPQKIVEAYDQTLALMKLKIIAGVLGLPLEKLRERDKAYQLELSRKRTRNLRLWLMAVIVLAVVAIGAAGVAEFLRREANAQRDEANRNYGSGLLERARFARKNRNFASSAMLAAKAIGFEGYGRTKHVEEIKKFAFPWIRRSDERLFGTAQELIHGGGSRRYVLESDDKVTKPMLPLWATEFEEQPIAIKFSPSGRYLVVGFTKRQIQLWSLATGELLRQYPIDLSHLETSSTGILDLAFNFDETLLTAVDSQAVIHRWQFDGTPLPHINPMQDEVSKDFTPRLSFGQSDILTMATEKRITLWDVTKGVLLKDFPTAKAEQLPSSYSTRVSLAVNSYRRVIATSTAGMTQITHLSNSKSINLPMGGAFRRGTAFHPEKPIFAFVDGDAIVFVDVNTGKIQRMFSVLGAEQVSFTPDGNFLIVNSVEELVKIESDTGRVVARLPVNARSFDIAPDGRSIALVTPYKHVTIWDISISNRLYNLPTQESYSTSSPRKTLRLAVQPDNNIFAIGDDKGRVSIYLNPYGILVASIDIGKPIVGLDFSPSGERLAFLDLEGMLYIWDSYKESVPKTLGHIYGRDWSQKLMFVTNDRLITFGKVKNGNMKKLRAWEIGIPISEYDDILTTEQSIAFDVNDKTRRFAYGKESIIRIIHAVHPEKSLFLENTNISKIDALKFSPSGRLLALGGGSELEVWDTMSGAKLLYFNANDDNEESKASLWFQSVDSLTFDAKENYLFSCSPDYLGIWDLGQRTFLRDVPLTNDDSSGPVRKVSCETLDNLFIWVDKKGNTSIGVWPDFINTYIDLAEIVRDDWGYVHTTGVSFFEKRLARSGWRETPVNSHLHILRTNGNNSKTSSKQLFWQYLRARNWGASALLLSELEDGASEAALALLYELGEACKRDDHYDSGDFAKYWEVEVNRLFLKNDLKNLKNPCFFQ